MATKTGNQQNSSEVPEPVPHSFPLIKTIVVSALLGLLAGLVASLCATLTMGILRLVFGIPTPVELFGDFILKRLDVFTFLHLEQSFSPNSKTGPLGLALLAMIGVGTALGLLYVLLVRIKLPTIGFGPKRREWLTGFAFALGMTLIAVVLFWDELRQNFFGLPVDSARAVTIVGLLLVFVIYGVVLCLAYRWLLPKVHMEVESDERVRRRRQLLAGGGVAALAIGGGVGTYEAVQNFLSKYSGYDGMKTVFQHIPSIPQITPNNEHYVVTQNPIDPTVDISLWRLEVKGLVNNANTYTFEQVQRLPSTSRAITLECIANGVGDHLIGNSIWHGVTLRTLLDHCGGVQGNARYAAFYSVDGYNMSLPLDEVLAVDALLAWNMNGVPLPARHGYPMRVLIPGHYGEENPKWLTRVEITDHFVGGLYSDQGWYNGPLHTISRIDRPRDMTAGQPITVPLNGVTEVAGMAFAGPRGIQKVEVSTDDGVTWKEATLEPPTSNDSWVFWTWQWKPSHAGKYTLKARATDGTGVLQSSKMQSTVPNGATGLHEVLVNVQ